MGQQQHERIGNNMIRIRKANDRGHADHGWLNTWHTFSFADYYDPDQMGFSALRVINEDRVKAGNGFSTHPHRDMEIITYVLEGALEHKDSMGNGSIIRPGDVQRMSAGSGITHSEFNPSKEEPVHFLQIWILPEKRGVAPGYEQKFFPESEKTGRLRLVVSHDGRNGSVSINQEAALYDAMLTKGEEVSHTLTADRHAWLQVLRGKVLLNGIPMGVSDGAAVGEEENLQITAEEPSELLLFDLA
jgi:hypothetical protein